MTDEEKAEKYVNTHCCYYRQDFIRTYLDGLAEERKGKWHDLRKNPNDLPAIEESSHNFSKDVLCALKFNDYVFYQVMSIHYPSRTWIVVDSDKNYSDRNVIAWCELPKFEE